MIILLTIIISVVALVVLLVALWLSWDNLRTLNRMIDRKKSND